MSKHSHTRREDLYPTHLLTTTPVDQDENLNKLIDFFGVGVRFTGKMAADILKCSESSLRKWIIDRQFWLQDCPEGVQIQSKKGMFVYGGGYTFVRGEE